MNDVIVQVIGIESCRASTNAGPIAWFVELRIGPFSFRQGPLTDETLAHCIANEVRRRLDMAIEAKRGKAEA